MTGQGHCTCAYATHSFDPGCVIHGNTTALPLNVIPIGPASAGRRIARRALDAEATSERLYLLEQALVGAVAKALACRREFEATGELRWEAVGEQLDLVAGLLCAARDGG